MSSQGNSSVSPQLGEVRKKIAKLPDSPGVYFFLGKKVAILYIGKATSLRDRVRSYFSPKLLQMRGPKLVKMMTEFEKIDFQKTDSVLEALILEANLIKKYQPPYNTMEKDDKSFSYVVITKEKFPRVLLVRGRDLAFSRFGKDAEENVLPFEPAEVFGPFPQGSAIREGLDMIRKIFPFRDSKCVPYEEQVKNKAECRPCFPRQIGLCPGVCTGEVSAAEYRKTIRDIADFFRGNKKKIIRGLKKRMAEHAHQREFEKAGELKRQIFALSHIHDISLIKPENIREKSGLTFRVEAYDVAHFAGKDVVGVMTVVENGQARKEEYRKFIIRNGPGVNDTKALREILDRRMNHPEWRLPNLIVVDGAAAQKNAAESVLERLALEIPVMAVTKDERHKPKAILGERRFLEHENAILLSNAEAHRFAIGFHKQKRGKSSLPEKE